MNTDLFDESNIATVSLEDWLDWCSGNNTGQCVALPLIQRGSVWKPNQIIDLWDSLLRGMPVGSFMVNRINADGITRIRFPGHNESHVLQQDALGLLDGQQRTLAMLTAWPLKNNQPKMDKRIWIDFADKPNKEHLFRLRVTTQNHPFGFRREEPSAKLSLSDRRKASIAYKTQLNLDVNSIGYADYEKSVPYHSENSLPVDLAELIASYEHYKDFSAWKNALVEKLSGINNYRAIYRDGKIEISTVNVWSSLGVEGRQAIEARIADFYTALGRFKKLHVPLIMIDIDSVEAGSNVKVQKPNDVDDPALAILFKRVGANGTKLSDEDYVFSVIKHRCPKTHDLVEELCRSKDNFNVASMLMPTDIVSTAVRLAAAQCTNEKKEPLPDYPAIDKKQFYRLLNIKVSVKDREGDFLQEAFLPLIDPLNRQGMAELFKHMTTFLPYKGGTDTGLPPHALQLLKRSLMQVILLWLQKTNSDAQLLDQHREEILRFILFWNLCVKDGAKASHAVFKFIRDYKSPLSGTHIFAEIYKLLVANDLALKLFSPEKLNELIADSIKTTLSDNDVKLLRGSSRFSNAEGEDKEVKAAKALYQKWWGNGSHFHPLLLWLQRDYVNEFKGSPAAKRGEDTPYDYDHILPSSHWHGFTGIKNDRIIDFARNYDAHYFIGNCIGNIRVWSSSDNRSDGDDSPRIKFGEGIIRDKIITNSLVCEPDQWIACSPENESHKKHWDLPRAIAFQSAVENRAFDLYKRFFSELGFHSWINNETSDLQ